MSPVLGIVEAVSRMKESRILFVEAGEVLSGRIIIEDVGEKKQNDLVTRSINE